MSSTSCGGIYQLLSATKRRAHWQIVPNHLYQSPVHNLSHENDFNFHVSEILFSYEMMDTMTGFEKEAYDKSEMPYYLQFKGNFN